MIGRIIRVNRSFADWADERNKNQGWTRTRFTDQLFKKKWVIEKLLDDPNIEKTIERALRNAYKK